MGEFFNTCEQLSVCKTLCDMSKKGNHDKSLAPCFICEIKKKTPWARCFFAKPRTPCLIIDIRHYMIFDYSDSTFALIK